MNATVRRYNHDTDYEKSDQFLLRTYSSTGNPVDWLQPRWEYTVARGFRGWIWASSVFGSRRARLLV